MCSSDLTSSVLLEVFDILGRKVTTLKNTTEPAGTYNVIWNGRNSDGRIIASGVYIYRATIHNRVTGKEISISKKAVYEKHAPNNPVWGRSAANANDGIKTVNGINEDYILKISGDDVLTTEIAVNLTAPSPIDLGTIVANAKPIIKSTANGVYDIDTKFDANNNRVTPTKIESLKVYLGSDPSVYTFTDSNGQFSLKVDKLGTDSLFITGATPSDTAYYNWHLPEININLGENEVTAFNDTTGIPMISRMYDTGLTTLNENNVGVDFLDYLFYVTGVKDNWPQYPEWSQTMPRIRDEDLPIKVFMNRAIAPNNWYADSSMAGLKATETGRYKFQEVSTADSALLIMKYDNNLVGEGTDWKIDFDTAGPYISKWTIRLRGPPGGSTLIPLVVSGVVSHEDLHIAFAGGNHSLYKQDLFYVDAVARKTEGYPLKMPEREEKAVKTIYAMERNPRLLDYTK